MKMFGDQGHKPGKWFGRLVFGHLVTWGHWSALILAHIQPSDKGARGMAFGYLVWLPPMTSPLSLST